MKTRNLVVQESTMPTRGKRGAEVRMRGQWLRTHGFHPGAKVSVATPSPGVIELRVHTPQPADPAFTAAIARF